MIHTKLAWHSLTHHQQQYLPFIIANSILIATNYIFITLSMHTLSLATVSARLGLVFILTIGIAFMFYVNSFLLKQRSRELGLYNMLGLTKHDLHLVIGIENSLIYLVSTIGGIIVGIIFEKLAFLMIKRLIKAPKARWLLGMIDIIILATGYYLSLTTKPSMKVLFTFSLALFLVIIGTYIVFIVGSTVFLHLLQKNKKFYYQPNHFISVSGMIYRMKQNGASLATICLLCTAVLVAMIASVSFLRGENNLLKQWNPYDIMMTTE